MLGFCSLISIPFGFIIGGIMGLVGTGYLAIFGSMNQIESAIRTHHYASIFSFLIVLLFTKVIIFLGGIFGAFLGIIPGFIGLYYCDCRDEKKI